VATQVEVEAAVKGTTTSGNSGTQACPAAEFPVPIRSKRRSSTSGPDRVASTVTRRSFLQAATALLAAPGLWLMQSLTQRSESLPESAQTILSVPLMEGNGIRFFGKVIVVRAPEGLHVFESKCTHLGCRINQTEGNEIVCPCHGSRFNARGEVVRGPAARGLRPLNFSLDQANATLQVTLSE